MSHAGPAGYLIHWSTGKLIHPEGGSSNPRDGAPLLVHSGGEKGGETRLQVRFIPVPEAGHFGYIEHVPSKKIIHPLGGSLFPENGTDVVYHHGHHAGCLFAFDEENERIIHRSGKIWHPKGGSPCPVDGTRVCLHEGRHDAARFYFVDTSMKRVSPYPSPNLSGDWKIVHAILNPKAKHTYTYKYTVGKSTTKTTTEHHAWGLSLGISKGMFSASATYSGFVELSGSETWSEAKEITSQIEVIPGETVVTWQYMFGMEQFGNEIKFLSNILADTNSKDVKPTM